MFNFLFARRSRRKQRVLEDDESLENGFFGIKLQLEDIFEESGSRSGVRFTIENSFRFWRGTGSFLVFAICLVVTIFIGLLILAFAESVIHGWNLDGSRTNRDTARAGIIFFAFFIAYLITRCFDGWIMICPMIVLMQICFIPCFAIHSVYVLLIAPWWVVAPGANASSGPTCTLCTRCKLIADDPLLVGALWRWVKASTRIEFYTLEGLRISAQRCHLCSLLLHSLPVVDHESRSQPASPAASLHEKSGTDHVQQRMQLELRKKTVYCGQPSLHLKLHGNAAAGAAPLIIEWLKEAESAPKHQCSIDQTTDGADVMDWAGAMVRLCAEEHEHCKSDFVPEGSRCYLPKRLIDLRDYEDGVLHVIDTVNLEAECEYMALSHCWGGRSGVMLKKDNLGLPVFTLTSLSRSFFDAAKVVRTLGVQYLWIDSLCIVQDDPQEWEIESTRMGLVYANAHCVISATAASDSTEGCARPRDLFRSDCIFARTSKDYLGIRWDSRLINVLDEKVESAPISKRAWTFQERYLARRTLHFASGCVIFECNEVIATDDDTSNHTYKVRKAVRRNGQLHSSDDIESVQSKILAPKQHEELLKGMTEACARLGTRGTFDMLWRFRGNSHFEKVVFNNCWLELIEQYSKRALTRHGDRQMAIAGMANFIQSNTDLEYVAGLWKQTLPYSLLWCVSGPAQQRPDRSMPSWSWASVDGAVASRLREVLQTGDGKIEKAEKFSHDWEHLTLLVDEDVQVNISEADRINDMIFNSSISITCDLRKVDRSIQNIIWDIASPPAEDLVSVPVLSFANKNVHPIGSKAQLHGLVLHRKRAGVYERVGYFWQIRYSIQRDGDYWKHWALTALESGRSKITIE